MSIIDNLKGLTISELAQILLLRINRGQSKIEENEYIKLVIRTHCCLIFDEIGIAVLKLKSDTVVTIDDVIMILNLDDMHGNCDTNTEVYEVVPFSCSENLERMLQEIKNDS
ncbi:uncharacterized protein PRCAT00005066001 [Priceomyces carsonii]|uniref:uncharacterized protein n=1 Tax=Priceomyces carsonii TaxID=28549 RepID=UPI002ED935DE|nr:unnamed protein product [Priceomyces carsonii]